MAERPDPDALLAAVRREEERSTRGHLTVFFGSAPGVGKTYAMLESARLEREDGRDVVVGLVETHGRYDTGALLLGLEILRRRKTEHKGIKLEELDLDAALERRPGLILVDELAHTNAPGSRHAKRWQDVDELLGAGIDVYTTLNVQHLESLNDVVAQITHVTVRETVPDAVFESADDVRLIDLPIDQLLERLREGKVYVPEYAELAREQFFREGNLIALRELALRVTATRVEAQMQKYREEHGIERTWAVAERVLVCVSASPAAERVIRGARRLASNLHADWLAVHVETPASLRLPAEDRRRVADHLRLAQSLGAETVTLSGTRGPEEVTAFARSRNVTRIVVGKPTHPPWRDWLRSSFLDEIVRLSGDIEVHVLTGERAGGAQPSSTERARPPHPVPPGGFVASIVVVAAATVLGRLLGKGQIADVTMMYVLGVMLVSLRWGLVPALFGAILAMISLDFFFVPPIHAFAVSDLRHLVTLFVMFAVATVISGLTRRIRDQADAARDRELRTASLYSLSRALARAKSTAEVASAGVMHVHDVFGARTCVLITDPTGRLVREPGEGPSFFDVDEKELAVAEWTHQHGRAAGAGTETLPSSLGLYVPLDASASRVGVLGVHLPDGRALDHDRRQHLEAFARQIASALERTLLAAQAHQAKLHIEAEQLRNSLLSSISHDLRTPLAVITGTASALLEDKLEPGVRRELTEGIIAEAERLNRLVRNLLDMTRLEAGAIEVKKEWQPIEEAIGSALARVDGALGSRHITTDVPDDLPLVPYDTILLQQVLVNLLENAAKYTPSGSEVSISARQHDGEIEVAVADRGPGLPEGEESKIFEKFYRAEKGRGGGVGLGLTICKGIVTAHGGRIWAETRNDGGAAFHFTLPIEGEPPSFPLAPEPIEQDRARPR